MIETGFKVGLWIAAAGIALFVGPWGEWLIRRTIWVLFWLLIWGFLASFATVCLYAARDLVQFLIKP
jgi:hypothetical protein